MNSTSRRQLEHQSLGSIELLYSPPSLKALIPLPGVDVRLGLSRCPSATRGNEVVSLTIYSLRLQVNVPLPTISDASMTGSVLGRARGVLSSSEDPPSTSLEALSRSGAADTSTSQFDAEGVCGTKRATAP